MCTLYALSLMLSGGSRSRRGCVIFLDVFPWLDLYYVGPAHHSVATGWDIFNCTVDHDLSRGVKITSGLRRVPHCVWARRGCTM